MHRLMTSMPTEEPIGGLGLDRRQDGPPAFCPCQIPGEGMLLSPQTMGQQRSCEELAPRRSVPARLRVCRGRVFLRNTARHSQQPCSPVSADSGGECPALRRRFDGRASAPRDPTTVIGDVCTPRARVRICAFDALPAG